VTDIIEKIEVKFGNMTVTRGKLHVFLGMDITFNNNDGTVTILMKEYLKEAIADSGRDASKVAPTPAKKDLFTVEDRSEQLDKRQGEIFHSIVAKLLTFQISSYRCLIGYCFPLHQGLVQHGAGLEKADPTPQYFNGTLDMPVILGADSLAKSKSWVDAAYAVHDDMESHRWSNLFGSWSHHVQVYEAETEYKEFY